MRPIIKWPGGKQREYKYVKKLIPSYDRYIEPFFGGGAVFFNEEPQKAVINDYNSLLMDFYRLIKEQDNKFRYNLDQFKVNWDNMIDFIKIMEKELANVFYNYRDNQLNNTDLDIKIESILKKNVKRFNGLFDKEFAVDIDLMFNSILEAVTAKIKRMKEVEGKKGERLPEEDIYKNIETGFRGGFYTHFRNILNDCNLKRRKLPLEKHIAIFYYIREFCYGSMFRYNLKGEFNIPYGGISYNVKDFASKINNLFNKEIENLFLNTEIHNKDFEALLNDVNLNKNDFVFLDPPYDTDFSTYGENSFDQKDHIRLARLINRLPSKCILVIKNTDFIWGLYGNLENVRIASFDKLYSYNVRGRNDRKANHLLIYNY